MILDKNSHKKLNNDCQTLEYVPLLLSQFDDVQQNTCFRKFQVELVNESSGNTRTWLARTRTIVHCITEYHTGINCSLSYC